MPYYVKVHIVKPVFTAGMRSSYLVRLELPSPASALESSNANERAHESGEVRGGRVLS